MNVKIESLKMEDMEQYKFLMDECFEESNPLDVYKSRYQKNDHYQILAAKDNQKIIGSITIYKIDLFTFSFQPAIEIFNVAVLKEYRGKKVAKQLLNHVIEYAANHDYKSLFLTCLDTAYPAHHLYESIGFKKMSSIKYSLDISEM